MRHYFLKLQLEVLERVRERVTHLLHLGDHGVPLVFASGLEVTQLGLGRFEVMVIFFDRKKKRGQGRRLGFFDP